MLVWVAKHGVNLLQALELLGGLLRASWLSGHGAVQVGCSWEVICTSSSFALSGCSCRARR